MLRHVFILSLALGAALAQTTKVDPLRYANMRYRMVGPERGGRVTAIAGVTSQPLTYYMGSTGGGVWKTTDAGIRWTNVSDGYFAVASMGAIEVSETNPNIVYAGTGSSKIRSNVSIGRGIYKSTDAGKTWTFKGLRDTGQISTVRIHPSNPDIVYVAALGNPFVPNPDRGVFRSKDGGKTWAKVLFQSDELGAADLEIEPGNPNVLYATLWKGQRKPWTIISGGTEGGVYKSLDGGDTWTKLGGGLPTGLFGRANVGISAANPKRVYALIEAKPGAGLYRSEDSGSTWTLINGSGNLITRPFYYTTLGVDPSNADSLFIGNEGWFHSTDGGKSFRTRRVPHGDSHDVWINPKNSQYMIQANDGGANVSLDGGNSWSRLTNQPTAEIYQVAVSKDLEKQYPYLIYGAQQDNTTLIIPSRPLSNGQPYREGPGCETGPIIPEPTDPNVVLGSCKGQFSRQDIRTGNEMRYWIGAQSLYGNPGEALIYRFQRVSPMEVSPHDPKVVYYGSQYIHRTRNGGVNWEVISPDLTAKPPGTQEASGTPITRDATGEEVYSTLYAIRESPVAKGVIWAGANDGPVHVSRDNGATWTNVTPVGLPPGGRVQNIEPSPHRAGSAYLAIHRYLLGDFHPYLYRTEDYGKTWTLLSDGKNGIAIDEPTRVVREDPDRAGLLYAGTEFGLYISFNNGAQWQPFQLNLPVTPITDIVVAHKDLIVATQGRSFWILDNLTPLHQLNDAPNFLFAPRRAIRSPGRQALEGLEDAAGGLQYPRVGAEIDYFLSSPASEAKLEILDDKGAPIRSITGNELSTKAGLTRYIWNLRGEGPANAASRFGGAGPVVPPGKYSARFSAGSFTSTQAFEVIEDPRITASGVTQADLEEQYQHNLRVRDLVSASNRLVSLVKKAQDSLTGKTAEADKLAKLNELAAKIITPGIRYSKPELQTHISYLYSMTVGADQKIGQDAIDRYNFLKKELDARLAELVALVGEQN
jgi:photosystem II stability/assembly factor-like uncharacterized protein